MSGRPYPEGVKKVLDLLTTEEKLLAEVAGLREQLVSLKDVETRLEAASEKLGRTTQEIGRLLEEMDVSAPGNFGYGGRMGWFLLEMRRLILGYPILDGDERPRRSLGT